MQTCRVDNSYMQLWVMSHIRDFYWRTCDVDTDGTPMDWPESEDAEFIAKSRRTYLLDFGGGMPRQQEARQAGSRPPCLPNEESATIEAGS